MSTQLGSSPPPISHISWTKLHVLPHFILWGRITDDNRTLAHLAITERHSELALSKTVWEKRLVPYRDMLDLEGHIQAKQILKKFERLWPCTFLAKEYCRR